VWPQVLLGKAASNWNPLAWRQEDVLAYLKTDALKPGLPITVLLVICLLTFLVLLLW
jgi:hypothetical protein